MGKIDTSSVLGGVKKGPQADLLDIADSQENRKGVQSSN